MFSERFPYLCTDELRSSEYLLIVAQSANVRLWMVVHAPGEVVRLQDLELDCSDEINLNRQDQL